VKDVSYISPLLRLGKWTLYVICGIVLIYLFFLPISVIFPLSFSAGRFLFFPPRSFSLQWYKSYFSDPSWTNPTLFSCGVAVTSMIFATILGTMASLGLVRGKFKGKDTINALMILPMIIPLVVTATSLFFFFAKLNLYDSFLGLVLGHTVIALPLVVINVSAVLKGFDITLEQAAMSLGANRFQTFLKVTFPIIKPGVISGAVFAFITSWDEVVIAIFLCGVHHMTLPKKMWESIRFEISPILAAISSILICISIALIVSLQLSGRKLK